MLALRITVILSLMLALLVSWSAIGALVRGAAVPDSAAAPTARRP